jgi:hypothetical protein
MAVAENQIRKAHKKGSGTDRLVTASRLAALERNLGVPIKRHRNPDNISSPDHTKEDKDETIFLSSESG